MRARMLFLVVAILLVAGFVALNWAEFLQTSPLSFGAFVTEAPLGLIMLTLLGLLFAAFLMSGAMHRTQTLIESRNHMKELERQRELADKAEASRFTDLRHHLDTQLRELRQRDAIAATEFEKAHVNSQRELRAQLDSMNRALAARLNEMEHRIETRLERFGGGPVAPLVTPPVRSEPPRQGHVPAQQVADARLREERAREEQLRAEQAHGQALDDKMAERREQERREAQRDDRPGGNEPTGWRRWF